VGTLLAVCRVHQLRPDPEGSVGTTAIDKRPVDGPVRVRVLGLHGDVQADRADHGGPDKALYAYADEAAQQWVAELGREVGPGAFGENLRTRGVDVDGAEIGERWRIGAGDDAVEVEVTMPRTPCATFARYLGEARWLRRFTDRGLSGAYLRVLGTGTVGAGDAVEVVGRPGHGVSVRDVFTGASPAQAGALLQAHTSGATPLAADLLPYLLSVAARG
jgi:MOSC domain-containing protein YiiM